MKKMLIIGQSDNPGGVETVIKRYFDFIKNDYQIDFLVFSETCYDEDYYKSKGCNIIFIKSAQFRSPFSYRKEIKKVFAKNKARYDVIWFNCCDLANCGYIMKQAKLTGIPKRIIHAHNNQLMQTGKKRLFYCIMHYFWKNNISRYATDFWSCSELAGKFFYKNSILESDHYKIIVNPICLDKYKKNHLVRKQIRNELNIGSDTIVIGNVGRFQYQKNHEFLIDIFDEFHKNHSNCKLLLVGQGVEEENIKSKVNRLGLESSVEFLGIRTDVDRIMQAMDLFLLPSRFEGLGIVLVEAQAASLPCITSLEVVPENVNITGNVSFISLDESIKTWVDEMEKQLNKKIDDLLVNYRFSTSEYDLKTAGENFRRYIEE